MTTELHRELMFLAHELNKRGDSHLATWIQKHIAAEQAAAKRRPSKRGIKVRLASTGQSAVLPLVTVNEALREAECE
jgi:hypothetical protein